MTEPAPSWTDVCELAVLQPERGVAALVVSEPVAVFRTHDDRLYAVSNVDPFSAASVLSRGIVGDAGGTPTVTSPVYKQRFDLTTGISLDDPDTVLDTYPVRVHHGFVQIRVPSAGPAQGRSSHPGTAR